MLDFDAAWALVSKYEGWLSPEQGRLLFDTVCAIPPNTCVVEIGSHHGRSTTILASAKPSASRFLAIDPWEDQRWGGGEAAAEIFKKNLTRAGLIEQVKVFQGTSAQALKTWDKSPIGLLYVDGAHDLPSVLIDIDGWEPFVADGGFVAIHDAFSSVGVTQAILLRHLMNSKFKYVCRARSLVLFQRQSLSVLGQVQNGMSIIVNLPYFIRNLSVKVARRKQLNLVVHMLGHTENCDPY